jgi:TolA-binding protein
METREGIALQNQILELRRDVQNLREQAGRGGPPPSSSSTLGGGGRQGQGQISAGTMEMTATLLDRVTALEDQMRRLNGRIDELDNASQRRSADLAKQIGDIQFRLDNPTQGGGVKPAGTGSPAPASLGAVPASPVPPPPPVRRTPALALQEGNAALARRDYAAAEAAAREVLAAGKAAPGSYDAQFLLAQASFGSRNYPQAAIEYNNTFDRSRQGSHAEDSLLGLAVSLNALGEKRSACAALDSLRSQFPTPRADVAQRAAAARSQAGCR